MTATFSQARDEIQRIFNEAWEETGFSVNWPDVPYEKPKNREPWARVTLRHATGSQTTLGNYEGKVRWRRTGFIIVQVFTPSGEGLSRAYNLSKIISDAFQKASSPLGVWFRNTRISEIGQDGDWYQMNVSSNFIYDEIS